MSFLKKRSVAIAIFVLAVALFTFLGARRSLDRACREAEGAFFDRSQLHAEGYYTCPGDQLEGCVKLANRLLSVIGTDGDWAGAYASLADARAALDEALDERDIPAIGAANQALAEAVQAVEAVKDAGAPLPESHDDYAAIISDFHAAQVVLDDPAYNEHILAFREDVLAPFPAELLRHLTGVRAPETFP